MADAGAAPLALVVEDEALIALAVEDFLLAEGFQTSLACDEAQAKAAASVDLALAVVSLRLGADLAGRRVIEHLGSIRPNLPVVVITGYAGHAPEADLRGLGGPTARLRKPADEEAIMQAVQDVLSRARSGNPVLGGRRRTDLRNSS